MGRGIEGARIFRWDADREDLLSCPGEVFQEEALGVSKAEVARFLGLTTSAVFRAAFSEDLLEILKYL
jgi:hypothetical protein